MLGYRVGGHDQFRLRPDRIRSQSAQEPSVDRGDRAFSPSGPAPITTLLTMLAVHCTMRHAGRLSAHSEIAFIRNADNICPLTAAKMHHTSHPSDSQNIWGNSGWEDVQKQQLSLVKAVRRV